MADTLEVRGLPVNSDGEVVATYGSGNRQIVGVLPPSYTPVDNAGAMVINLESQVVPAIYLDVDAEIEDAPPGCIYWDKEYSTVNCTSGIPGVTYQIGQELTALCTNNTGSTLPNGAVVCIIGADVGSEHPNVELADANIYSKSQTTIGLVTSPCEDCELVVVTRYGLVHDIDLPSATYAVGDVLFLGETPGSFTTVKTNPKDTMVRLGWVNKVNSAVGVEDGEIIVDPLIEINSEGYYLDAQVRDASTALPTTPTPFVWTTEVADSLSDYDNTTGVITIPFTGVFNTMINFNAFTSGSVKQLYLAAQILNGSTWEPLEYTTRQSAVRLSDKHQVLFTSQNKWDAGTQIRFVVWSSAATVDIITESVAEGYTVVASRVLITGSKTI